MTAIQLYEAVQIELNKVKAPSMSLASITLIKQLSYI